MFSSNKNIESISQLIKEVKHYIGLQKEYVKLDVVEKTVILLSALILGEILIILAVLALFYLSFTAVFVLAPYVGQAGGYGIVSAFCILLLIIVFAFRKKWIEKPLTKFLFNLLLNDDKKN